jgi:hypothetical protein
MLFKVCFVSRSRDALPLVTTRVQVVPATPASEDRHPRLPSTGGDLNKTKLLPEPPPDDFSSPILSDHRN